jgi:tellurite resistance protein TerC
MLTYPLPVWIAFHVGILAMLAIDLRVVHGKAHEVHVKEAFLWSVVWIVLALCFAAGLWAWRGTQVGMEFLTGYLVEKALSVDNLFVFWLLFSSFRVPALYQHKVLFWGILGALLMRALFIAGGVALMKHFHWLIYPLGVFLIVTGFKLGVEKGKELHLERNPVLHVFKRLVPVTEGYHGDRLFIRQQGRIVATPLFAVLVAIETTDLVFAADSIPAIIAITKDPFIVYTSNIFAILGLRALYFVLVGLLRVFRHLHYGLACILVFLGVKMVCADLFHIPVSLTLGAVGLTLLVFTITSLCSKRGWNGTNNAS